MTSFNPILSIITINYNDKVGLERTLKSVVPQTYKAFEFLVIDGGSTDGSKELIEANKANINYWVSEPDKGIYNAMNKGIIKANGEYLLFINSGDELFSPTVLEENIQLLTNHKIIYFNVQVGNDKKNVISYPKEISFNYLCNKMICHQAIFFHKSLFNEIGLYDETLKLKADWKLLILAICKYNISYLHINTTLSIYDTSGISSTEENHKLLAAENEAVLYKEFPMFMNNYDRLNQLEILLAELKKSRLIKELNYFGFLKKIKHT